MPSLSASMLLWPAIFAGQHLQPCLFPSPYPYAFLCQRTPNDPHQLKHNPAQDDENQQICKLQSISLKSPIIYLCDSGADVHSGTRPMGDFSFFSFFLTSLCGLPRLAASERA